MRKNIFIILVLVSVVVLSIVYATDVLEPSDDELTGLESGLPAKEPLGETIEEVGRTIEQELLLDADLFDPLDEEDESLIEEDPSAYEDDSFSDFDF